jgi:predicted ATP-dependent protease
LLLSALSDLPINQSIAVTGSVNQKGEVQAIGGVNEKIEGYYDVCKLKGFNGSEGVIIPKSNVRNLMLREDVVKAVKDNKFKIWAVDNIDEGIEILTGVSPGKKKSDGEFTKNSVYDRVNRKLKEFRDVLLRCDKMRIEGLGK